MPKWSIEQVRDFAAKHSYQLLSTSISTTAETMSLICPAGHEYNVKWSAFYAQGNRCKECYLERSRKRRAEARKRR